MTQLPTDNRWAPWYYYVVPVVVLNLIKQQAMKDQPVAVNAVVTIVLIAAIIGGITWFWRRTHQGSP